MGKYQKIDVDFDIGNSKFKANKKNAESLIIKGFLAFVEIY